MPDDEGKMVFAEVQGFDQFEKVVLAKVKDFNTNIQKLEINILPIR